MLKRDEVMFKSSCLNRAHEDEMVFVLLARDAAAPVAIRAWIAERIRLGKNKCNDPQLIEAEMAAERMKDQCHRNLYGKGVSDGH